MNESEANGRASRGNYNSSPLDVVRSNYSTLILMDFFLPVSLFGISEKALHFEFRFNRLTFHFAGQGEGTRKASIRALNSMNIFTFFFFLFPLFTLDGYTSPDRLTSISF